jgi:hypothetical protein
MAALVRDIPEFLGETGANHEEISAGTDGAPVEIVTEEFQNTSSELQR